MIDNGLPSTRQKQLSTSLGSSETVQTLSMRLLLPTAAAISHSIGSSTTKHVSRFGHISQESPSGCMCKENGCALILYMPPKVSLSSGTKPSGKMCLALNLKIWYARISHLSSSPVRPQTVTYENSCNVFSR